jgi:hypothetical protein
MPRGDEELSEGHLSDTEPADEGGLNLHGIHDSDCKLTALSHKNGDGHSAREELKLSEDELG